MFLEVRLFLFSERNIGIVFGVDDFQLLDESRLSRLAAPQEQDLAVVSHLFLVFFQFPEDFMVCPLNFILFAKCRKADNQSGFFAPSNNCRQSDNQ